MKSVFFNRGALLTGLFAMVFSTASLADIQLEPTWVRKAWTGGSIRNSKSSL